MRCCLTHIHDFEEASRYLAELLVILALGLGGGLGIEIGAEAFLLLPL